MRHFFMLASVVLLAAASMAKAQYPRGYDDRYGDRYYDRGEYNRGPADLFGRVRADLERAEADSHWKGGDRRRFAKVREELNEFERSGSHHELNDAISALQHVVNDNRLAYRDRDMLAQDLYRLRDFRARNGWR